MPFIQDLKGLLKHSLVEPAPFSVDMKGRAILMSKEEVEEREGDWDLRINFASEFRGDKSRNCRESPTFKFKRYSVKNRWIGKYSLFKKISSCVPRRDHSVWLCSVWLLHFNVDLSISCPLSWSPAIRPVLM